jgi:hypothetical protein
LTPADVAQWSGFSLKTVYRAIRSGTLEASQPTARYRITPDAYERWVFSRRSEGQAPSTEVVPATRPIEGSLERLRRIEREAA